MILFLSKSLIVGLLGGALGILTGLGSGRWLGLALEGDVEGIAATELATSGLLLLAVLGAPMLTVVAGWIPAMIAAQQDPVAVLREK